MRTAIYLRVSTDTQAEEGYSIDAQKERLISFIHSQGWELFDIYVDDGYSAKDLDRPAIQKLIKDMRSKSFDVVLVYKLDRLVRSVSNLHELLGEFEKYGVKFKSSTEVFETTSAMGRFFITLVASMAQWERETIAERVKMGMDQKHLKGERNGAAAPIGYDLIDGELIINPIEANIVKRIFELYKSKGANYITKLFNKNNVPKKNSGHWTDPTIMYILKNPIYCGKLRWNHRNTNGKITNDEKITYGSHDSIISEEKFDETQKIIEKRKKSTGNKKLTSDFVYSGILRCGRCGNTMYGRQRKVTNGIVHSYYCYGRFDVGVCDMPITQEKSITKALLDRLNMGIDDEIAKQFELDQPNNQSNELIESLEEELTLVQKRKKKWQEAYANDAITLEELKGHTTEDRKKEEWIKEQLASVGGHSEIVSSEWSVEEIKEILQNIQEHWDNFDRPVQKQFLNELFESLTIYTDKINCTGGPGKSVPVDIKEYKIRWG